MESNQEPRPCKISNALAHPLVAEAHHLFNNKNFADAIPLLQKFIEETKAPDLEIDGLGNNELSIGYYQWFISQWYSQGIQDGIYSGTPYDLLSLCYLSLKGKDNFIEPGIKWYRSMLGIHPKNYQLRLGLANILGTKSIYEEAIDLYNQVLNFRPGWVRPLQCIAYIYEYKRIEKAKAIETANKILQFQPTNRVALFVLARNEKNPDSKIEKLKRVSELHPKYARAINQIGIVFGGTKKEYDEAIAWYKKCVEVAPQYASCYNNIGVNYELKKEYGPAIQWYFRAIEKDREYKAPHKNMSDIFDEKSFTDEQIEAEMSKYNIQDDYYYYYLGLSYYDKKKYELSIKFYMKAYANAKELGKDIHKLHNSTGITYDEMRDNQKALDYYNKCIAANPNYHSAYYNIAIVYKRMNKTEDAINWYKKAIEVNPRYSYAYNNLGNIYKNMHNYEQAIKCYKNAIEHLSTYTLALANLGVCYLKLANYRDAFNAMARAKEIFATDNNNLSESNKTFLKETLEQFDKQGQIWRQNGFVTTQLKSHLQNYESAFKNLYAQQDKEPVNKEKVMKKQVLQIICLLHQDRFTLGNLPATEKLIRTIFSDNEDYFHFLPQIFVEYFCQETLKNHKSVLAVEEAVQKALGSIREEWSKGAASYGDEFYQERSIEHLEFKYFNPQKSTSFNVFRQDAKIAEYSDIYDQLMFASGQARDAYKEFKAIVDLIRKQSHGIPYGGVQIKIPSAPEYQFQILLPLLEEILQGEEGLTRRQNIIQDIHEFLKVKINSKQSFSLQDVQNYSKKAWAGQINSLLQKRCLQKRKTVCEVGDLIRGKIIFECSDHLKQALIVADEVTKKRQHQILRLRNDLVGVRQEVVLNIQIKGVVCELRLSLKQDQTQLRYLDYLENLATSPLGVIFGSCLWLRKELIYPLLRNCQDIVEYLTNQEDSSKKDTLQAVLYVIESLNESSLAPK